MSELVSTRIRTTAGKLGLPHLAEALTQYAQRADEAKLGYLDFIDLVLSEELAVREDRRFRTGLRDQGFSWGAVVVRGRGEPGRVHPHVAQARHAGVRLDDRARVPVRRRQLRHPRPPVIPPTRTPLAAGAGVENQCF
ncbi:ATP-binding protein [Streptomyces sp. NBC_00648]